MTLGDGTVDAMPATIAASLAPLVLPDVTDRPVRLGSLWETRPVVLAFLRHYG